MNYINSIIRSNRFTGKVIRETEKAILIKTNDFNQWVPKSVINELAHHAGVCPGQDINDLLRIDIECDIYDIEFPFWFDTKTATKGHAF